jgi:ubiquinone/menaquinone biosynthesis C-methylase UbiE/DNA-binding transcriptional ArsR family regulator
MDDLLAALRAAAEPTRLRLLALAARGAFCVTDFTEILGQSQPRLSRHLKLLCEAGLLDREREGANAWFALPEGDSGLLVRDILARLPTSDPILAADRRQAARVLSERARAASESFRRQGEDWDEMSALGLPAASAEAALLDLVGPSVGRLLDIGTGTGRLLELLGPRAERAVGIDASRAMLALARSRLARADLGHCTVRLADMYRLPMADATFDVVTAQMVLHHAEDPAGVLAEAARVLRPGGLLVIVDLAPHGHADWTTRLAHRWPGFTDATLAELMRGAGLEPAAPIAIPDAPALRLWPASLLADMPEDAASLADVAL